MKNKTVTLIGFGKIVLGLLYSVIGNQLKTGVTFICCVRASEKWLCRRNDHPSINAYIVSDIGIKKKCASWQFNESNETFSEFSERCNRLQNPGIWIIENDQMFIDAIENSNVVGTSVGVEALDDLLNTVSSLNIADITLYAFENQPPIVKQIASKYNNINVVHCPIDRVVVSREFDDENGIVIVKLGKDPSESIMIYDVNGAWENILDVVDGSSLTITDDSRLLNLTLKKKLYAKNIVHKVICQMALCGKSPIYIRDKSLCDVATHDEIEHMKNIKPALLFPAVIDILSEWTSPSIDIYHDIYKQLSSYYDSALETVSTDPNDTIGRIIHLDSPRNAENDRIRLLSYLRELESTLSGVVAHDIIPFLSTEMGTQDIDYLLNELKDIKSIIYNIKWDD